MEIAREDAELTRYERRVDNTSFRPLPEMARLQHTRHPLVECDQPSFVRQSNGRDETRYQRDGSMNNNTDCLKGDDEEISMLRRRYAKLMESATDPVKQSTSFNAMGSTRRDGIKHLRQRSLESSLASTSRKKHSFDFDESCDDERLDSVASSLGRHGPFRSSLGDHRNRSTHSRQVQRPKSAKARTRSESSGPRF